MAHFFKKCCFLSKTVNKLRRAGRMAKNLLFTSYVGIFKLGFVVVCCRPVVFDTSSNPILHYFHRRQDAVKRVRIRPESYISRKQV